MKKTIFKKSLAWVLTLMMVITFMPSVVFAAPGDAPKNDKTVVLNEDDGTYEIELSITGEALVEEEQTAGSVNVLLVYDVSQSMSNRTNGTSGFNASGPRRADEAEDIVHDFLVKLTDYQNSAGDNIHVSLVNFAVTATQVQGWTTDVDSLADRFGDGGNYNDAKFSYTSMGTNWDHALQLARALMESNTFPSGNPTFVIMVTDGAPTAQGSNATSGMSPANRDWWEFRNYYNAATDDAAWIASQDDTTMFGIYAYGTESDLLDDLLYYAKNGEHRSYGNTNLMTAPTNNSSHNYGATEDADNYFNAESTEALQEAVSKIFEKVVQALGITEVAMSDGTTSQVDTSTGVANLLHVDESSYKYYLTIPLLNGKFKDNKNREITVSISGSTATFTWTEDEEEKEATYTVVSQPAGAIKVQWTEETAFYPGPPDAVFEDGAVNWDLKDLGTLLDGVTYSYAFACSPSQYTNDLIADLKNGSVEYGDPDYGDVWDYIKPNADGTDYSLKTNTETSISYKDTRMDEPGPYETEFPDKPPVPTKSDEIYIEKNWVGEYRNEQLKDTINMDLLRDGEKIETITLDWNEDTEKPKHTGSKFIATGQMTVDNEGKINIFAPGHDYKLEEPEDLSYHWELVADIMHPMIINGTMTMLVLVDEADIPDGMADDVEYYKDGDDEYYRLPDAADDTVTKVYKVEEQEGDEVKLTATNYRRSNLNLTKAVIGEAAPEGAEFEYNMKVTAPTSATGDDLVFWFSVRDADNNTVYEAGEQTSATKEEKDITSIRNIDVDSIDYDSETNTYSYQLIGDETVYTVPAASEGKYYTGYYYFDSGSTVKVTLQEGWNLRFTNVLTGTEYVFEETNAGENNFEVDDIKAEWTEIPPEDESGEAGTPADPTDVTEKATIEDATITGKVEEGNAEYLVTFTNKYELTAAVIEKTFSGIASSQIPTGFQIEAKYKDAEGADQTLILKTTDTDVVKSNNDLTYTWTINDLPKATKVSATETPGTAPTGYTLASDTVTTGEVETVVEENKKISFTNAYTRDKGTLTVTKTFAGIAEALIPDDFMITINGLDDELTIANGTKSETGLTYTWTINDVETGDYTVSENGEAIAGYSLTTDSVKEAVATVAKTATDSVTAALSNAYEKNTEDVVEDDSVTINKVDEEGEALSGATFQLKDGETVVAEYTDQSFEISTDDADLADYLPAAGASKTLTLTESEPPAGYEGDSTSYDVVISASAKEVLDEENDVYVTTTTYTMTVGGEETLDVTNTKKTDTATVDDSVTVSKVDQDNEALTGATFQLKDGETVVATYTDQSFEISTDDAELADYLPAAGASMTLTLTESAPPAGYTGDATSYDVVISAAAEEALDEESDTFVTTTTYTMTVGGAETKSIVNTKKTDTATVDDSVTVSKVDQDNEALTGATFQLKDGETVVATYTDQSFEISTDDAELADYLPAAGASTTLTLTESAAPAGYEGDSASYDVVISAAAEEALDEENDVYVTTTTYTMTVGGEETLDVANTKKTDTATVDDSVTVNKVDGDGKALSGATFQLKDGETVVATYTNQSFTIGTGDAALASYLPAAGASKTLTLTETKVPNGYEGDTASHNVVISAVAEEALDTEKDAFVTTTTYTVTIDGKEAANIVNNKKASPPPPDIPDEPIPLDLNGEDHFAYIEGYPDGTVQPEGNITRAEVTTMIYRLLTEDRRAEIFTDTCDYSDVEQRHWFNKAVSSMTVGEYVTGYPHGIFKPNQAITRAEFVTIVVRFLEGERDAENPFTDIDGHWAQKYILSAVDAGWIDGYPDGTFKPNEPIKRCEAMKIMNTILHRGINEESELGEPVMFPDNADPSIWYYYEVIEATNDHETEGERPDEDWLSNECEYVYDIVKYERPDPVEPEGEGE